MSRVAIFIFAILTASGIMAQSPDSIKSLDERADSRLKEISQQWTLENMPEALKGLRELYNIPGMSKTEYSWRSILYNLTCAHSLLGHTDSAIVYLTQAVAAGYSDYKHMLKDSDLDPLRSDKRFTALLNLAQKKSEFWDGPLFNAPYAENLTNEEKLAGLTELWFEVKLNFAFFDHVPDLDWDSLYAAFIPRVTETVSTYEYFRVLQKFCAQLKDGHTGLNPPRELWPLIWGSPPLGTMLIGDTVVITAVVDTTLDQIKVGMEIMRIDGIPVKEYAEQNVRPYLSASTPQGLDIQTYTYFLLNGPEDKPVNLSLRDADGRIFEIAVSRKSSFPSIPEVEYRRLEDGVTYINTRTFSDDSAVIVFDSLFDTIASSSALIIDVRKNGGGNSGNGWKILGYLTDTTFTTLRSKYRTYSPQTRYLNNFEKWDETVWDFPPNGEKLYSGPVIVLAGPRTGSAAEDFLVAFDFMDRGVIIGEPTYGSTGQPLSFPLPGGISARVCFKRCSYPDGKEFVGVGVQPDIFVRPTVDDIRFGRDPVLEEAVKYIRAKAQQK